MSKEIGQEQDPISGGIPQSSASRNWKDPGSQSYHHLLSYLVNSVGGWSEHIAGV